MKYHASYDKKFYEEVLAIHRVRCQNPDCDGTHAIIPSFSVPCCSFGTRELNQFIKNRADGKSVDESGQCFIDKGMCADFPESINKRLSKYSSRMNTIFPNKEWSSSSYADFIMRISSDKENPVLDINTRCLSKGFNPVLFSRINILMLPKNKSGSSFSHDPPFWPLPGNG